MSQHEAPSYKHLHLDRRDRLLIVTMDHPPINLLSVPLAQELSTLTAAVASDDSISVLLLKSANPEFFLAHFDVEAILAFPIAIDAERDQELNWFHQLCERLRTMNTVTIAQVEGRVGGGGSEIAASCDMRFGVAGQSIVCQMEVPLGILPGGSGTQRLPRLLGRGRALEVILAGDDIDAETAERWGYFNRLYSGDRIDAAVLALASRIASFPPSALRLAKRAVDASALPGEEGLREEAYLFQRSLRTDAAQRNMRRFLEQGGQTRDGELRVGALAGELGGYPRGGLGRFVDAFYGAGPGVCALPGPWLPSGPGDGDPEAVPGNDVPLMTEWFETFTDDGEPAGLVARSVVHQTGLWHRAVNVLLFRSNGQLITQRRSATKDLWPNTWDLSVAEHLQPGESYLEGALRGLKEELGLSAVALTGIGEEVRRITEDPVSGLLDRELQRCFYGVSDAELVLQKSEVADTRLYGLPELKEAMQATPEAFTPWFRWQADALQLFDAERWLH